MANELDELEKFLSVSINNSNSTVTANGVTNGSSTVSKINERYSALRRKYNCDVYTFFQEHEKDESFSIKEDLRERYIFNYLQFYNYKVT